jgi:hypothetical protein
MNPLNTIDAMSPAWHFIEAEIKAELESLHRKNEHKMGAEDTAHLRGQMAMARRILNMAERDKPLA